MARPTHSERGAAGQYGRYSEDLAEIARTAGAFTRTANGIVLEVHGPLGQPHRRPRPVCAPERVIYELEVVGSLEAINEDIRVRQLNAHADPDLLDFEWFLTPDGRFLTLLCTYADVLAQQRSFVRSMRNPLPESLMVLKSMRTYGTRALRLTTDPPPGWTEVMLLTEHQEPVGRRSFQR